ncbi:hypothetical protein [Vibrio aestuarianus]|uniref:hypothetical protein n=1 Tax=Vibrio aestuarianus TaxID=28171 RepID=UPI00237C7187|nr:hypothetical protein [Vibrio aestuarianus]MDE1264422.1 hypothetical protein [Vibrio aestuarianus]MDE1296350.1 hypothetical protein [Vibrio aestuarianus]
MKIYPTFVNSSHSALTYPSTLGQTNPVPPLPVKLVRSQTRDELIRLPRVTHSKGRVSQRSVDTIKLGNDEPCGQIDKAFAHLIGKHHQDAQEFMRKGHNSKVPTLSDVIFEDFSVSTKRCQEIGIDSALLCQLLNLQQSLSKDNVRRWLKNQITTTSSGKLGSRSASQSLTRRIESVITTLIGIADYLVLKKQNVNLTAQVTELLIDEFIEEYAQKNNTDIYAAKNQIVEQLKVLNTEEATEWEALNKITADFIESGVHAQLKKILDNAENELIKLSKKLEQLCSTSTRYHFISPMQLEVQDTLMQVKVCLQLFIEENKVFVAKQSVAQSPLYRQKTEHQQSEKLKLAEGRGSAREPHAASLPPLKKRIQHWAKVEQQKLLVFKTKLFEPVSKNADLDAKLSHTGTNKEAAIFSIYRCVYWLYQQPLTILQRAAQSLAITAQELETIKHELNDPSLKIFKDSDPNRNDGQWSIGAAIKDKAEMMSPAGQRRKKLTTLIQLHAKNMLVLKDAIANTTKELLQLDKAIAPMLKNFKASLSSHQYDQPKLQQSLERLIAVQLGELRNSLKTCLEEATKAVTKNSDSDNYRYVAYKAETVALMALVLKETLSNNSISTTGKGLDDLSLGSRLAKYWAKLLDGQLKIATGEINNLGSLSPVKVHQLLKKHDLIIGITTKGDPEGFLFATRIAQELENIKQGNFVPPMSPAEFVKLEKSVLEFMVNWGQRRFARGLPELAFELATDVASGMVFNVFTPLYRIPIAVFCIPFKLHQLNTHIMPSEDLPNKAIVTMLQKRLINLGFNMVMSPLPSVVKTALGGAVAVSGHAFNVAQSQKEGAVDSIYGRLVEGNKSQKLRIDTVGTVLPSLVISGVDIPLDIASQHVMERKVNYAFLPSEKINQITEDKGQLRNKRSTSRAVIQTIPELLRSKMMIHRHIETYCALNANSPAEVLLQDKSFMAEFSQLTKNNFDNRLKELGFTRDKVHFLNVYFSEDGAFWENPARLVHNIGTYYVENSDKSITFFSTISNETLSVLNSWEEARRQINQKNSPLANWVRAHTAPKQRELYNHNYFPSSWADNSHLKLDGLSIDEKHFENINKIWLQHIYPVEGKEAILKYVHGFILPAAPHKYSHFDRLLKFNVSPHLSSDDIGLIYDKSDDAAPPKLVPLSPQVLVDFYRANVDMSKAYFFDQDTRQYAALDINKVLSVYHAAEKREQIEKKEDFLHCERQFDQKVSELAITENLSIHDLIAVDDQHFSWYELLSVDFDDVKNDDWPVDVKQRHQEFVESLWEVVQDYILIPYEKYKSIFDIRQNNLMQILQYKSKASSVEILDLQVRQILNRSFRELLKQEGIKNIDEYSLDDILIRQIVPRQGVVAANRLLKKFMGALGWGYHISERVDDSFSVYDVLRNTDEPSTLSEIYSHRVFSKTLWNITRKYPGTLIRKLLDMDVQGWWRNQSTVDEHIWKAIQSQLILHGAERLADVEHVYIDGIKANGIYKINKADGSITLISVVNGVRSWTFSDHMDLQIKIKQQITLAPSLYGVARNYVKEPSDLLNSLYQYSKRKPLGYRLSYDRLTLFDIKTEVAHLKESVGEALNQIVKNDDEIIAELVMRGASAALTVAGIAFAPFNGGVSLALGVSASVPHFINGVYAATEEEANAHIVEGVINVAFEVSSLAAVNVLSVVYKAVKNSGIKFAKNLPIEFIPQKFRPIVKSMKVKGQWNKAVDDVSEVIELQHQVRPAMRSVSDVYHAVKMERMPASEVVEGALGALKQKHGISINAVRSSRGDYVFSEFGAAARPISITGQNQEMVIKYLDTYPNRTFTTEIDGFETIYAGWEQGIGSPSKIIYPLGDVARGGVATSANIFMGAISAPIKSTGGVLPGSLGRPISSLASRLNKIQSWQSALAPPQQVESKLIVSFMPQDGLVKVGTTSVTFQDIAAKLRHV